jgi:hypothetical protein
MEQVSNPLSRVCTTTAGIIVSRTPSDKATLLPMQFVVEDRDGYICG